MQATSPDTHHASRITHYALAIILILFTAITLYNSILLPIGEAADETDHYQYHRFVAHSGHPPLTETERREAGFKGGLAPLYYVLTAWPIAIIGEETPPDIRRVDARPERHIPTDGLGINHVLHTLDESWPWRGQTLAWHLVRFLSLPMAWVTLITTYALVRQLRPQQPIVALIAVAFVAFLPRFVISSAVINDDNLVFALTALLLLTQIKILQSDRPPTPKIMAIFGALFGLSLVTKYFSLILIPEIILTITIYQRSALWVLLITKQQSHPNLETNHASRITHFIRRFVPHPSSLLIFLMALLITAGAWFTFIAIRFNRIDELGLIPGLAASLGEPQITEGLVGLLAGQSVRPVAATYPLSEWLSLLYRSFWFEYGWMQLFAPMWVYWLFTTVSLLALISLIVKISRMNWWPPSNSPQRGEDLSTSPPKGGTEGGLSVKKILRITHYALRATTPITWLLTLHLALFVVVLLARYILSATIDTGQGRHLYPALPVIALLIAIGLNHLLITIYQLPFPKQLSQIFSSLPATRYSSLVTRHALPAPCYLLLATCYLLPAFFSLQPQNYILPYYQTIPASATPILLPVDQRQSIEFDSKLWLVGLETNTTALAGDALPVTLHWFAEEEAQQDYFISLCLQDEEERPATCWRGHIDNGRYLARAWEKGDTLADTIYLPIPTCGQMSAQSYALHLEIWPLEPTSAAPVPLDPPLVRHTFSEPQIIITPAGDSKSQSQESDSPKGTTTSNENFTLTPSLARLPFPNGRGGGGEGLFSEDIGLWLGDQRLTQSTTISSHQSLAVINYADNESDPLPAPKITSPSGDEWLSLAQFDTPLYLPCDEQSNPVAHLSHFIADPTLTNGTYKIDSAAALPEITIAQRDRILEPIATSLSFNQTLAPLSLHLPDDTEINLQNPSQDSVSPYQLPITNYQLPITLRWQAQRWMAEPLVVALKLLDNGFNVGGERVATLGDRYPNVLWIPGEIVDESYPIQIKPDTPPGIYVLEMSLLRQDDTLPDGFEYLPLPNGGNNLYPLTVRLLDPQHDATPPEPLEAEIGASIKLIGYETQSKIQNPKPVLSDVEVSKINLALYWESSGEIGADYTVFTQLIGPDGQPWAQWDNPPQAGRYPTGAWLKQDRVVDRYRLTLREGAPAGNYRLLVGMYDPATGNRLPVTINGQAQADNTVELTTIFID